MKNTWEQVAEQVALLKDRTQGVVTRADKKQICYVNVAPEECGSRIVIFNHCHRPVSGDITLKFATLGLNKYHCLNGVPHSENDVPSLVGSWQLGTEYHLLVWHDKGKVHRIGGPAFISFEADFSVSAKRFFLMGKEYDERAFWKKIKKKPEAIDFSLDVIDNYQRYPEMARELVKGIK